MKKIIKPLMLLTVAVSLIGCTGGKATATPMMKVGYNTFVGRIEHIDKKFEDIYCGRYELDGNQYSTIVEESYIGTVGDLEVFNYEYNTKIMLDLDKLISYYICEGTDTFYGYVDYEENTMTAVTYDEDIGIVKLKNDSAGTVSYQVIYNIAEIQAESAANDMEYDEFVRNQIIKGYFNNYYAFGTGVVINQVLASSDRDEFIGDFSYESSTPEPEVEEYLIDEVKTSVNIQGKTEEIVGSVYTGAITGINTYSLNLEFDSIFLTSYECKSVKEGMYYKTSSETIEGATETSIRKAKVVKEAKDIPTFDLSKIPCTGHIS